ncbi:MAG: septum formation initiator family protein [Patescibacteria group bacterium]|nr:septum formation initiator family protein [Patescibacteria group bacterium]
MNINIQPYRKQILQLGDRLQDVRFIGQVAFVVIVLLISWSGVKSIQTNYALQKQITGLSQQNDLQLLQNANLELSNNYYKSNQYLELSARQNFGLAAAGEKEIVVPKAVALSKTQDIPVPGGVVIKASTRGRNNFEAWVDFFLHRTAN